MNKFNMFITAVCVLFLINKAIIEYGFRRIWKILQISEDVIHLCVRPLWITPSLICRILQILLSLIIIINSKYFPVSDWLKPQA